MIGCDRFISSPTGRYGMAMAREAWPIAPYAQCGVYFLGGLFPI